MAPSKRSKGRQVDQSGESTEPPSYELAEPRASALVEALRSVGYTPQTAIADLVDNSISARSRNVWLQFEWAGPDSWISIADDGFGMAEAELASAMRAGSRNPLDERPLDDLGRFGLGLKTASFSQARRLTVVSRRSSGKAAARTWDLDYVGKTGEWRLLNEQQALSSKRLARLRSLDSGTMVVWENLDRVTGEARVEDASAQNAFLALARRVSEHLAMTFHRFLAGSRPRLRIFINGDEERHKVSAWDPFLESHIATSSPSDADRIIFKEHEVLVKGFVLPHRDKLSDEEYVAAAGPGGWNAQQGFYVYRNQRLLLGSGWLGLGYSRDEHHKLARIRVDIPNSTDFEWAIDIKKSRATPPSILRQRLKEVAELVRRRAREIYAHRGRSVADPKEPLRRVWLPITRKGHLAYKIDRSHPLVRLAAAGSGGTQNDAIEALLSLVEGTVPIQQIWLDTAEGSARHASPLQDEPPARVQHVISQLYRALRADGVSPASARARIASIEPFNAFPELLATLNDDTTDEP